MLSLLCRAEITVVVATFELKSPSAMRIIGSQQGRGQVLALNCKMQGGHGYSNGQCSQRSNHQSDLQRPRALASDHDVSRKETDERSTEFYLICVSGRVLGLLQNRVMDPQSIPRFGPVYNLFNEGEPRVP